MRDVRVLSDILLEGEDWSVERLQPYAEEWRERMRRMRSTASLVAALSREFCPEARGTPSSNSQSPLPRWDPAGSRRLPSKRVHARQGSSMSETPVSCGVGLVVPGPS